MDKVAVDEPAPKPQTPAPLPSPRAITSRNVFSNPEAHPVVLDLVLLKKFKLDWLSWLPDTLFHEIEQEFKTSIADINRSKILAAQSLHVVDTFWHAWEVFEKTIHALNGNPVLPDVMQPPDLEQLFAGVDTVAAIRTEPFDPEVAQYCAAVFLNENVHYAPPPLDFCQVYLAQPFYKCKDCGKRGSALPPFDNLCSSCAGHFDSENVFSLKPDKELVDKGHGRNISIEMTFNPGPVAERYTQLNALPPDKLRSSIKETSEDIQAAKLIIAMDFKEHRAQQLKDQLAGLRTWLEGA